LIRLLLSIFLFSFIPNAFGKEVSNITCIGKGDIKAMYLDGVNDIKTIGKSKAVHKLSFTEGFITLISTNLIGNSELSIEKELLTSVENNGELFVYPKGEDKRFTYRKDKTGYSLTNNNVSEEELIFRVIIWPPSKFSIHHTLFIRVDRATGIFESEIYLERESRTRDSEWKRYYTFVGDCKKTNKNKF